MCSKILTSIGLITDMVGVILLFIYGLPSKIVGPPTRILEQDISDDDLKRNKFIEKMSYAGLILLVIGFLFQLISTWSSYFC